MANRLPQKIIRQIEKAGLPTEGAVPFEPLLERNKRGRQTIATKEVAFGPKKGKRGYVDINRRIWIKDRAHAGDPDHWDVQEDGGKKYFRVDLQGNLLPKPKIVADNTIGGEGPIMAAIQKPNAAHRTQEEASGLLAIGSSGAWTIDVDEVLPEGMQWRAQLDGPSISLDFGLRSLDVFDKLARFPSADLQHRDTSNGSAERGDSLLLGGNDRTPVLLVKDDEYDDRFFIRIGQPDDIIAWFTISGKDVSEISEAARQIQEELEEDA